MLLSQKMTIGCVHRCTFSEPSHESDVVVHTKAKLLTYLDTKKVTTPVVQAKATGKPKIFSPVVPCEVTVSAAVKANLS